MAVKRGFSQQWKKASSVKSHPKSQSFYIITVAWIISTTSYYDFYLWHDKI